MPDYSAYGLTIRSQIELPELLPADERSDPVDLDIVLGSVAGPMPEPPLPRLIRLAPDESYFAWPGLARMRLARGGRLTVEPLGTDSRSLRFALLGPVIAGVLHRRGIPLLHGSAVRAGHRAVLTLGHKGAGKSTMAAALASAGCRIVSDDVLPLTATNGECAVTAGYPGLKLTAAVHNRLLPQWAAAGDGAASASAKSVFADPLPTAGACPIGAILILEADGPSGMSVLPPAAALTHLLQHAYALKFGEHALNDDHRGALFAVCARLASEVPVTLARRPEGIERMAGFAERFLSHLGTSGQSEIRAAAAR